MNIEHRVSVLSLFGSFSTLICCALPALFVALGAGATFASLISVVPQLIWFSEHKLPLFIGCGILLLLSGILQWNASNAPCPIDPQLAKTCKTTRRFSLWIYGFAILIYLTGLTFAFILPALG